MQHCSRRDMTVKTDCGDNFVCFIVVQFPCNSFCDSVTLISSFINITTIITVKVTVQKCPLSSED